MNTTELDRQIAVMQAFRDGSEIECRGIILGITPWHSTATTCWDWSAHDYRVKPQKKLRPWNPDEVPVGAQIRDKARTKYRLLITSAYENGLYASSYGISFDLALAGYDHSTDGGKTWHPCGVEVEE